MNEHHLFFIESLIMTLSLALSLCLSVTLSLCLSLSFSLALCQSLSLSVTLSLSLSVHPHPLKGETTPLCSIRPAPYPNQSSLIFLKHDCNKCNDLDVPPEEEEHSLMDE